MFVLLSCSFFDLSESTVHIFRRKEYIVLRTFATSGLNAHHGLGRNGMSQCVYFS